MRGYLKFVGVLEFLGYIFGIVIFSISMSKLNFDAYGDKLLNTIMVISFILYLLVGPSFAITVFTLAGLSERVDDIQEQDVEKLKSKIELLEYKVDRLTAKLDSESKNQEKEQQ